MAKETEKKPAKPKSRKSAIAAIIIILIAVGAAAYYTTLPPTPTPTPTAPAELTVGFTIALTGTFAVEGHASLNGIKTAVAWVNDHGGVTVGGKSYKLAIKYYEDQSQTSNIVPLYTKLVQDDKVNFLLAPYSSPLTVAAAPISDQFNILMMSHGGAADSLWTHGYKYFIGVLSPATYYLRPTIDYLKANHKTDKIAFIYADDVFTKTASEAAASYAKSVGLQVVYSQSYPTTVKDISPLLTAARDAGADDIIGGGHFQDGLLLTKQLQQIGWKPKFLSILVAVTEPAFHTQLGNAAEAITGPSQWEGTIAYGPDLSKPKGIEWFGPTPADFVSLYQQVSGGARPTYHSAEAGAAIIVLSRAIEKANSLDTATIRQSLGSLHLLTFFGEYQVDQTGKQIAHQMVMVQWQNGVLKLVWPAEVAASKLVYPYG